MKQGGHLRGFLAELRKNHTLYLFIAPAAFYTFVFGYATLPYLVIAFQKYSYKTGLKSPFVGFDNFRFFFSSTRAWEVTRNTIWLNFLFLIFGTIVALTLAICLNELNNKPFVRITQSTMLFPYFISWVIVSYILYAFLASDKGMFNHLITALGGKRINWYSQPQLWRSILVFCRVWKGSGYTMIIYLATITGIDRTLNEAAAIDGANRWQMIRYITLPLLAPTVCILMLLDVGKMFYGDFGMVYALVKDSGQLLPKVDVIDTYVYRMLRVTGDPSNAMAVNLYQSVVGFIMVFTSNWIVRRTFPDGALF